MRFFSRDPDSRPKMDEDDVAHSLLYFLWRDDLLASPRGPEGTILVMGHVPSGREAVIRELFCLRYIAATIGVSAAMPNSPRRHRLLSMLQIIQLAMTGDPATIGADAMATMNKVRRSFTRHIAESKGGDADWAEAVVRTQSYVPPFALLKHRLAEASPVLQRHAPDAQGALEEMARDFCARIAMADNENVEIEAFAYLCLWKNAVENIMPMFRWK